MFQSFRVPETRQLLRTTFHLPCSTFRPRGVAASVASSGSRRLCSACVAARCCWRSPGASASRPCPSRWDPRSRVLPRPPPRSWRGRICGRKEEEKRESRLGSLTCRVGAKFKSQQMPVRGRDVLRGGASKKPKIAWRRNLCQRNRKWGSRWCLL